MNHAKNDQNDYWCDLLTKIAQKDEVALGELYMAFDPKIFAFAKIRLNDSHEAADLLNEVMWEIWRGAGKFEGRSSVTTWILGIAHHKILDRIRSKSRQPMEPLELSVTEEADYDLTEILSQKQVGEHILHCMEKLSSDHRQVVHLAYFEDLSYREIGELMGSPEGTIKARMFHAKQALKRCLSRRMQ